MSTHGLMNALRAWLAGRAVPPLSKAAVDLAFDNRLAGLLYHIQAPLSEFDRARTEARWTANLAAHLHRVQRLNSIWTDLPPPLIYKGADLAEHIYDDPGARRAGDLDLIVPSTAYAKAIERLRPQAVDVRRSPHEALPGEPMAGIGFDFGAVLIEVHLDPQPRHRRRFDGDALYRRGSEGALGALQVRFPSAIDRVLICVTNQAKTGFCSDLADLLDLTLCLKALGSGRASVLRKAARTAELSGALELCLLRCARAGLPTGFPPRPSFSCQILARTLPRALSNPVPSRALQFGSRWWSLSSRARISTAWRYAHGRRS